MKERLYFLDNLKIFLTVLVVFFHTSIGYGAGGNWYFEDVDKTNMTISMIILTIFTLVCQAFFMSLFFFISGYFVPRSYDKKGIVLLSKERFIKLGIPLLIYTFWLGPTVIFLSHNYHQSYLEFFKTTILHAKLINFGPLWFVEALIYFNLIYFLYKFITKKQPISTRSFAFPTNKRLLLIAVFFGILAFFIRLFYPTGKTFLGLQLGYFPLYVLMFYAGILSFRQNWLTQINKKTVILWWKVSLFTIPILPVSLIATGALNGHIELYGGFNLQSLVYSLWEPFVCFGFSLKLLFWFKEKFNQNTKMSSFLSKTAYGTYIVHPIVVVFYMKLFVPLSLFPTLKLFLVAPLAILFSFLLSTILLKIPFVKKIF